jgi:hypothetical protein
MPWLGPHAELVACRPGFVKAKLTAAPAKPRVFHGVFEVLRMIVRWRPVDVLEVNWIRSSRPGFSLLNTSFM